MIKIGKKIRQYRDVKKMSQEELAFSLETSQKTISNWETDRGFPTFEQLAALEKILDADILSWFEESGIIFNQKINNGDNAQIINKDSEKLIEQYEKRIAEKDAIIDEKNILIKEQKDMLQLFLTKFENKP